MKHHKIALLLAISPSIQATQLAETSGITTVSGNRLATTSGTQTAQPQGQDEVVSILRHLQKIGKNNPVDVAHFIEQEAVNAVRSLLLIIALARLAQNPEALRSGAEVTETTEAPADAADQTAEHRGVDFEKWGNAVGNSGNPADDVVPATKDEKPKNKNQN